MSIEKVVDNGSFYSFPEPQPYVSLKPGKYYPGYSNKHGFILLKNSSGEDAYLYFEDEEPGMPHEYQTIEEKISEDELANYRLNLNGAQSSTSPEVDEDSLDEEYNSERYFNMQDYNSALEEVEDNVNNFINNKEFFERNKLDYKRSILLFSVPGTGKTWYIKHKCENLIKSHDAIVINVENSAHLEYLSEGMQTIDRVLEDRLKIIVVEELAEFCRRSELKTKMLQLLDSPFFRNNMLFFVTTNEPESIPANLIDRPSRLDVLANINIKSYSEEFIADWYQHNTGKKWNTENESMEWFAKAKKSLTPVYWAELFKFSELQQISLEESWNKIKARKQLIKDSFADKNSSIGFN